MSDGNGMVLALQTLRQQVLAAKLLTELQVAAELFVAEVLGGETAVFIKKRPSSASNLPIGTN